MKRTIMVACMMLSVPMLVAETMEGKMEALVAYKPAHHNVVLDYNPFVSEETMVALGTQTQNPEDKTLRLLSVMNQKAFISGKWYGVGDRIENGKVSSIKPSGVEIIQGGKKRMLQFESAKSVLHVKDANQ